jgi:hypothetical protein
MGKPADFHVKEVQSPNLVLQHTKQTDKDPDTTRWRPDSTVSHCRIQGSGWEKRPLGHFGAFRGGEARRFFSTQIQCHTPCYASVEVMVAQLGDNSLCTAN